MHNASISTRRTLRQIALIMMLLLAGSAAAGAQDVTRIEAAPTVAHILPGDRAIAQVEALDPANAGVSFVLTQAAGAPDTPKAYLERLSLCIPCDNLA